MTECPKCHFTGGGDWAHCRGRCAMSGSPCYDPSWAVDFELLKLAAKAIGGEARTQYAGAVQLYRDGEYVCFWNPLVDDSDAFRLAVALQLSVHNEHVSAGAVSCSRGDTWFDTVDSGSDEAKVIAADYAATRRAIVLAAAEIGRLRLAGKH